MAFTNDPEKNRELWHQMLKVDFMSSEESDKHDEEEFVINKPLPWRSVEVNSMLLCLDKHVFEMKSFQARRQMKKQVEGEPS